MLRVDLQHHLPVIRSQPHCRIAGQHRFINPDHRIVVEGDDRVKHEVLLVGLGDGQCHPDGLLLDVQEHGLIGLDNPEAFEGVDGADLRLEIGVGDVDHLLVHDVPGQQPVAAETADEQHDETDDDHLGPIRISTRHEANLLVCPCARRFCTAQKSP